MRAAEEVSGHRPLAKAIWKGGAVSALGEHRRWEAGVLDVSEGKAEGCRIELRG